jgi:hypothetical protein
MIIVAVVAAGLGYVHHRKSAAFRRLAEAQARKAGEYEKRVKASRSFWEMMDSTLVNGTAYLALRNRLGEDWARQQEQSVDRLRQDVEWNETLLAYHQGLEGKYRRAAAHPWLPVAPDPPQPIAISPAMGATVTRKPRYDSPPPIDLVASLPKGIFELGEHPILGGAVPLTIEYRNRSERPVTICPVDPVVAVADIHGNEPERTAQGRWQRPMPTPSETRRQHATIVLQPGESHRDEGLDLTVLYRLKPGYDSVRVIFDDPPLWAGSEPVGFWVRRRKWGGPGAW